MDRATATLKHIKKSGEYTCIPNVPVFDEHDEWDAEGNLVRRFDRKKLQAIVDTGKAKEGTGDLTCIGPGHTLPNAPETQQPPVWGYAANWKLDSYGPEKRLAAVCDYYIRKTVMENSHEVDGIKAVLSYPRRSIELWPRRNDIDWIALLRKAPERPMGLVTDLVTYARREFDATPTDRLYYPDLTRSRPNAAEVGGGKLRYSMEAAQMPFDPDPTPLAQQTSAEDPTKMPNTQDDAEEKERILRYVAEAHPWLADETKQRFEAAAAAPTGPGALSPTNGSLPTDQLQPPEDDKMEPFSREAQEEIAKLKEELAKLAKEKDEARLSYSRAESERALDTLKTKGFEFNREAELNRMVGLTPEDRKKHADHIARYYRSSQSAPTGEILNLGSPPAAANNSYELAKAAKDAATRNGTSFDAEYSKLRGV